MAEICQWNTWLTTLSCLSRAIWSQIKTTTTVRIGIYYHHQINSNTFCFISACDNVQIILHIETVVNEFSINNKDNFTNFIKSISGIIRNLLFKILAYEVFCCRHIIKRVSEVKIGRLIKNFYAQIFNTYIISIFVKGKALEKAIPGFIAYAGDQDSSAGSDILRIY